MPHGEPWEDTLFVTYDCSGKVLSERKEHWQADSPPPSHKHR
jgi:hypothetical protein